MGTWETTNPMREAHPPHRKCLQIISLLRRTIKQIEIRAKNVLLQSVRDVPGPYPPYPPPPRGINYP